MTLAKIYKLLSTVKNSITINKSTLIVFDRRPSISLRASKLRIYEV